MADNQFTGSAASALGAHSKDTVTGLKPDPSASAQASIREGIEGTRQSFGSSANGLRELADGVAATIRDQPLVSVLVAGAIGWLIGRIGRYI